MFQSPMSSYDLLLELHRCHHHCGESPSNILSVSSRAPSAGPLPISTLGVAFMFGAYNVVVSVMARISGCVTTRQRHIPDSSELPQCCWCVQGQIGRASCRERG